MLSMLCVDFRFEKLSEEERWNTGAEVAQIAGRSEDVVRHSIQCVLIEAFICPEPGVAGDGSIDLLVSKDLRSHLSKIDGPRSFAPRLFRQQEPGLGKFAASLTFERGLKS